MRMCARWGPAGTVQANQSWEEEKGFFLNSPCSQRFLGQECRPLLWPLSIERDGQRNSHWYLWSSFRSRCILVSPKTAYSNCNTQGRLSPKQNSHQPNPTFWNKIRKTKIQHVLRDSYFTHIVLDYALSLNTFIFSNINIKIFAIIDY